MKFNSLQALCDRAEILNVIASYAFTLDFGDAEGWAALFTDDGRWALGNGGASAPSVMATGQAELKRMGQSIIDRLPAGSRNFHHQTSTVFDALGEASAATRTLLVAIGHALPTPPSATPQADVAKLTSRLLLGGAYHDAWRKGERGWLIATRTFVIG